MQTLELTQHNEHIMFLTINALQGMFSFLFAGSVTFGALMLQVDPDFWTDIKGPLGGLVFALIAAGLLWRQMNKDKEARIKDLMEVIKNQDEQIKNLQNMLHNNKS